VDVRGIDIATPRRLQKKIGERVSANSLCEQCSFQVALKTCCTSQCNSGMDYYHAAAIFLTMECDASMRMNPHRYFRAPEHVHFTTSQSKAIPMLKKWELFFFQIE